MFQPYQPYIFDIWSATWHSTPREDRLCLSLSPIHRTRILSLQTFSIKPRWSFVPFWVGPLLSSSSVGRWDGDGFGDGIGVGPRQKQIRPEMSHDAFVPAFCRMWVLCAPKGNSKAGRDRDTGSVEPGLEPGLELFIWFGEQNLWYLV